MFGELEANLGWGLGPVAMAIGRQVGKREAKAHKRVARGKGDEGCVDMLMDYFDAVM